ncbi:MAG: TraI domain-containing protein, partial [Planctomycetota bacterium]
MRFQGVVRTFPVLPRAEILKRHATLIDDLLGRCSEDGSRRQTQLRQCIEHLARMVNSLPASESAHDNDSCGLFRHALEAAVHAIQAFDERLDMPALERDPERRDAADRKRLGVVISCLAHDLGKMYVMRITIDGQRMLVGATGVEEYAERRQADRFEVQFRSLRTSNTWHDHEPLGLLLLPQICPPGLLLHVNLSNLNQVIWSLSKNLSHLRPEAQQTTKSLIRWAMKLGDQRATILAQKRQLAEQQGDDGPQPHPQFGRRIVEDFLAGFRRLWQEGKIDCNGPQAHVLVSTSHSIVFIDRNRTRSSLLDKVYEHVHDAAKMAGAGPGYLELYRRGSPEMFIRELAVRFARGREQTPLIIPQDPQAAEQTPEIRHYVVFGPPEERPRDGWGMIIANQLLWGSLPYQQRVGCFEG